MHPNIQVSVAARWYAEQHVSQHHKQKKATILQVALLLTHSVITVPKLFAINERLREDT